MTEPTPRVDPERLRAFSAAVLIRVGLPPADADLVVDTLVQADLWNHQSHGVMRLRPYVERLRAGVVATVTRPELVVDAGAVAVLDGCNGVGQVVAARAAREAARRARAHGVGAVAVRGSNHFGTAAYFTRLVLPDGCIGILTTNASPAMAPWGGREQAVGTDPWSVAAPAGRHPPLVLDIANTAVARGKIHLARQQGLPIPLGWVLDAAGEPTTDPAAALTGVILPMAGHKGYGIAVVMDVLSGVLSGSRFGAAVHGPYQTEHPGGVGHLMLALNIASFLPLAEFTARMEALIAELKAVPRAPGVEEICYPGELEARSEARHRREGLALPERTLADLGTLAAETGVDLALPSSG